MAGDASRTHGVRLPAELLQFVAAHGESVESIDALCAVSGPGSFTGLRVGLATLQGIAMTARKPVVPIPTLEAMAAAWADQHPSWNATLVTCLDGARADVFYEVFEVVAGRARSVAPASVATPLEAAARIAQVEPGPELTLIGDAASRYRAEFASSLPEARFDDRPLNLALGGALRALAQPQLAVSPHALRPLYVRRPDAVLARERAQAVADPARLAISQVTTAEDLAAVADLQRRSFANAWGAEAIQWELDNSKVARMYAARADSGELVAYCACWFVLDELHINSVAVAAGWRRRRVARRLLERVLVEAAAGGARSATLEVRESNEAARKLYEGLGFRVEGIRRAYYQDPREDGLILWHRDLASRFGR